MFAFARVPPRGGEWISPRRGRVGPGWGQLYCAFSPVSSLQNPYTVGANRPPKPLCQTAKTCLGVSLSFLTSGVPGFQPLSLRVLRPSSSHSFTPVRTAQASALSERSAFPLSGPPPTPPRSYGPRSARSRSSTGVDRPLEDSLPPPSRASRAVCALPAGWSPWFAHALGHAEIHRGCERSSAPGHQ